MNQIDTKTIAQKIYVIRGQKVMLDKDLAELYEVTTKRLKEQVKRNALRFPADFMFEPNIIEIADLRSQFATSNDINYWKYNQTTPYLFTENGIAMLSSVLKSEKAILINITIMRIFTKLRNSPSKEYASKVEVEKLKKDSEKIFQVIFEKLENLEVNPPFKMNRKKIGLK